ncbi:MAG TPA: S9 family peptidase [Acidimicrobiales bacterium]|nr:S9 family peptidase [Acidimicrobiales bacterium]
MRGMRPDDIARLTNVSDPRVSPDGQWVAFVVTTIDLDANRYRGQIWAVPADGSRSPRPLTSGEFRDALPRWSPDGARLAFVSHRDGEGNGAQLWLLPSAGGEAEQVCRHAEEIDSVAWSPDGSRLAFTARARDEARYGPERDRDRPARRVDVFGPRFDGLGWTVDRRSQVYVVDAGAGASPVQVTDGPYDHRGVSWAPDGSLIVTSAARHAGWDRDGAVDLWLLDAAGAAPPRRLTETGLEYGGPSWSPDGSRIACRLDDPRVVPTHGRVAVVDVATGAVTVLTGDYDRNCCSTVTGARDPLWDRDRVLFQADDAGNMPLMAVTAGDGPTGVVELVVGGDRQVSGFDLAGGTLAVVVTSPVALPELAIVDEASGEIRRCTSFGKAFAADVDVARPERFVITPADGVEIEAWVMRPIGAEAGRRYPTLVNIHGGPFTQYGNRFFDEFQLQAAAGYCVVYSNPRGSSGYSEAFGRAIRGPKATEFPGSGWGGVDFEDVMAVVDAAVARFDCVDGERLGVLGGSYGGYLTSWTVGHTNRFKAAVSERAVNNLLTMTWTSDIGVVFNRGYIGISHLDDPSEYLRQSPTSYVRQITTPMLLLHSEDDWRCPVSQAEELWVALRLLDRDVEFVRFPGEGHELSRSGAPRHRIERAELILDWFARKL